MSSPPVASMEDEAVPWVATVGRWLGLGLAMLIWIAPTPAGLPSEGQRLAAVVVLMAIWWVTLAAPISVTSLLPVALFPWLGIQSADAVGKAYFNDNSFLYLGGFIIALGIERWGLHRRFALLTVCLVGTSPHRIVLGFLLATFALSMWISNTATTLLMLPIATALIATLEGLGGSDSPSNAGQSTNDQRSKEETQNVSTDPHFRHFAMALTMGIAYAASIGGLATLVGTPTNIQFVSIWSRKFNGVAPVSAGQWMLTWTPFGLTLLLCTWVLLVWGLRVPKGFDRLDKDFFRQRLRELGPIARGEALMLLLFVVTATLWILRTDFKLGTPVLIPGWSHWLAKWLRPWGIGEEQGMKYANDSTVAMTVALLMFLIPVKRDSHGQVMTLMDWKTASKLPWEILLLFGGGFALADAFESTRLSIWTGEVFASMMAGQPLWLLVLAICFLLVCLTEFTSNIATVNAVLPVIAAAAVTLGVDPRLLMIPATVATSCGFMMPIGTPPNAIVMGTGRIKVSQMASYGLILNLLSVVLVTIFTFALMVPQLGIKLGTR